MANLTRRSVFRSSLGLAAAGALGRSHIANAAAMNNGMTTQQAVDKAFRRAEEIFAKYPIQQA